MKIASLAKAVSICVIAAVALTIGVSNYGLYRLEVGGPLSKRMSDGQDLIAEILPPPLYVIEAYLEATLIAKDPSELAAHQARLAQLHKDYNERYDYWGKQAIDDKLKSLITTTSHQQATRFWKILDEKLVPAASKKDAAALQQAFADLRDAYNQHRQAIDNTVKQAKAISSSIAADAGQESFWIKLGIAVISGVVMALVFFSAYNLIFNVIRRFGQVGGAVARLANGDHEYAIPLAQINNEVGDMARSLEQLRLHAVERIELEAKVRASIDREVLRQRHLQEEVQKFRSIASSVVETLVQEVEVIRASSQTLTEAAQVASSEAGAAATVSASAADNSNAVATAAEELGYSIREISTQSHRANTLVESATSDATRTNDDVAALAEAAEKVGSVVALIRGIADQTNLLALNATIESARAGEAGRGFAVVAAEVKELSAQTAKATDAIAVQIEGMQASTTTAVAAIRSITEKVQDIQGLTGGIASAVEEQTAATNEIARNVHLAANGSRQAAQNSAEVTAVAKKTTEEASAMVSASGRLHNISTQLNSAIKDFVSSINKDLQERRTVARQTLERDISVGLAGKTVETRTVDVSPAGMRIHRLPGLAIGQNISVDVGGGPIDAKVMWIGQNHAGLQFAKRQPSLLNTKSGQSAYIAAA